jgi:hypothetical protein
MASQMVSCGDSACSPNHAGNFACGGSRICTRSSIVSCAPGLNAKMTGLLPVSDRVRRRLRPENRPNEGVRTTITCCHCRNRYGNHPASG